MLANGHCSAYSLNYIMQLLEEFLQIYTKVPIVVISMHTQQIIFILIGLMHSIYIYIYNTAVGYYRHVGILTIILYILN